MIGLANFRRLTLRKAKGKKAKGKRQKAYVRQKAKGLRLKIA